MSYEWNFTFGIEACQLDSVIPFSDEYVDRYHSILWASLPLYPEKEPSIEYYETQYLGSLLQSSLRA